MNVKFYKRELETITTKVFVNTWASTFASCISHAQSKRTKPIGSCWAVLGLLSLTSPSLDQSPHFLKPSMIIFMQINLPTFIEGHVCARWPARPWGCSNTAVTTPDFKKLAFQQGNEHVFTMSPSPIAPLHFTGQVPQMSCWYLKLNMS